jgi:Uma2 family endonuclease
MIITVNEAKTYTTDEYLALEVEAETRNEYRNGEILPMTGGTPAHNEITGDLIFLLKAALKGKPYSIFVTDQRLWIPKKSIYTYPDVMVVSRPIELQLGRKDTVINPVLIAEVLSDSTKAYDSPLETLRDRDEKFEAYRSIETFQEYLLIDQYKPHVEQYAKQDTNRWLFTEYNGQDARVPLASISVEIALVDLYESIEF